MEDNMANRSLKARIAAACSEGLGGFASMAERALKNRLEDLGSSPVIPFVGPPQTAEQMPHRLIAMGRALATHFAEHAVKHSMDVVAAELEALEPQYQEITEFMRRFPTAKLPEELEEALARHGEVSDKHARLVESYRFFQGLAETPFPAYEPQGDGALVLITERIDLLPKAANARGGGPAEMIGTVTYLARISPALLWKIEKRPDPSLFRDLEKEFGAVGYLNARGERCSFGNYRLQIVDVRDPLLAEVEPEPTTVEEEAAIDEAPAPVTAAATPALAADNSAEIGASKDYHQVPLFPEDRAGANKSSEVCSS